MEGNTQEKIEKVAYEEFLRKGYESTNLRTISNMVGIKAASIYFYYKSKSELFLKIYDSICEKYNNIIETILSKSEKDNPAKVLYQLVLARMQDCMNNSLPFQFLFRYYLFPVEDLQDDILCIQKKWEEREFQLIRPVISTCMSTISLQEQITEQSFFNYYKRFEALHITDYIVSKKPWSEQELLLDWEFFLRSRLYNLN